MSTGGQMNPEQPKLIAAAIAKMPAGSTIIAATDHDQAGDELAADIRGIFNSVARDDLTFVHHKPKLPGWDFNDVLCYQETGRTP